ncbi:MAG: hypothetical protein ACFB0D_17000 [Phormidesmis sp.]
MPTKSKEQPTVDKNTTAKKTRAKSTSQKTTRKKATQKASAKKTTAQRVAAEQSSQQQAPQQTLLEMPSEVASAMETAAEKSVMISEDSTVVEEVAAVGSTSKMTEPLPTTAESSHPSIASEVRDIAPPPLQTKLSGIAVGGDVSFSASELMPGDIWAANSAIPALDEATYAAQKAQAEAQRRAIEVASLNLQNINDLHKLERQSIDVAISTKTNETRNAQLAGAGIDYQTQLEVNGEKSQHLAQSAARHQAATRETGYADQLISLKDQNFELEIQQAQNVFAEKAARYRAQLTGQ